MLTALLHKREEELQDARERLVEAERKLAELRAATQAFLSAVADLYGDGTRLCYVGPCGELATAYVREGRFEHAVCPAHHRRDLDALRPTTYAETLGALRSLL